MVIIGTHKGIANYTIGQRKGIGVMVKKKPLYVKKSIKNKIILFLPNMKMIKKIKFF